jgi:hypothetical protein
MYANAYFGLPLEKIISDSNRIIFTVSNADA